MAGTRWQPRSLSAGISYVEKHPCERRRTARDRMPRTAGHPSEPYDHDVQPTGGWVPSQGPNAAAGPRARCRKARSSATNGPGRYSATGHGRGRRWRPRLRSSEPAGAVLAAQGGIRSAIVPSARAVAHHSTEPTSLLLIYMAPAGTFVPAGKVEFSK